MRRVLAGAPLALGRKIGEGGEGAVWRIQEDPDLCAKLYPDGKADEGQASKAQKFAAMDSALLEEVAAWPRDWIADDEDRCAGYVMEFLRGWQPLFVAYQIRARTTRLSHASFGFLVRAARNLAACLSRLHNAGIVVGDLNESNTLVNDQAVVKLIDTDSFQAEVDGRLFPCAVAKPELLAPELHNRTLADLPRTPNHDGFPLAVLIFQLLAFGRHPFAGVANDGQEATLEQNIVSGSYAYSRRRHTRIDPPAHLDLSWLPPRILELFEDAFDPSVSQRPSPDDWYEALIELESDIVQCEVNPAHRHWTGCASCPWCRLEEQLGLALFGNRAGAEPVVRGDFDLETYQHNLAELKRTMPIRMPVLPDLDAFEPKPLTSLQKMAGGLLRIRHFALAGTIGSLGLVLTAPVVPILAITLYMLGAVLVVASGLPKYKLLVNKALGEIANSYAWLAHDWHAADSLDDLRDKAIEMEQALGNLEHMKERAESLEREWLERRHMPRLTLFLRKSSIAGAGIAGSGYETRRLLSRAGIETAAQISHENLARIRGLDSGVVETLVAWRDGLIERFWATTSLALPPEDRRRLQRQLRQEENRLREVIVQRADELRAILPKASQESAGLAGEADKLLRQCAEIGPYARAYEKATGERHFL